MHEIGWSGWNPFLFFEMNQEQKAGIRNRKNPLTFAAWEKAFSKL
jgi:hypothetical protein